MTAPERSIAFFDFDGTVTYSDTMFAFFRYAVGPFRYVFFLLLLSPVFALYKLKLLPGQKAKELSLTFLFKGMRKDRMENLGRGFCREKMNGLIRPQAMEKINWHRSRGHEVFIVSASAGEWLDPWCRENELPLLCTRLLYDESGVFTGKIDGKNNNAIEKERRIKEAVNLTLFQKIYAYGDTSGDREMLDLAHMAQFKPFRRKSACKFVN